MHIIKCGLKACNNSNKWKSFLYVSAILIEPHTTVPHQLTEQEKVSTQTTKRYAEEVYKIQLGNVIVRLFIFQRTVDYRNPFLCWKYKEKKKQSNKESSNCLRKRDSHDSYIMVKKWIQNMKINIKDGALVHQKNLYWWLQYAL